MGEYLNQTMADSLWELQLQANTVFTSLQEVGWGFDLPPLPNQIHICMLCDPNLELLCHGPTTLSWSLFASSAGP